MRRRRRILLITTAVLGLLVLVAWSLRDRPRRLLAKTLGARLGATVTIGHLEIEGRHRVRLHDVTIRDMASQPRLGRVTVPSIEAEGNLRAVAEGNLRALHLRGGTVILQTPRAPAAPTRGALPRIDRLTIEGFRIQLPKPGRGDPAMDLEATIRDFGTEMVTGHVHAQLPAWSTAALVGALSPNRAATLPEAGHDARLPGPATVDLTFGAHEGGTRFEIDGDLPRVHTARAMLLRGATGDWQAVDITLTGVALDPWHDAWPWETPWTLDGALDLAVQGNPLRGMTWTTTLSEGRGAGSAGPDRAWRASDVEATASGIAHREEGIWHSSLDGTFEAAETTVHVSNPQRSSPHHSSATPTTFTQPLRVVVDGRGRLGPVPQVDGAMTLSAGRWGQLAVEGTAATRTLAITGQGEGTLAPWLPFVPSSVPAVRGDGRWRADFEVTGAAASPTVTATINADDVHLASERAQAFDAQQLRLELGGTIAPPREGEGDRDGDQAHAAQDRLKPSVAKVHVRGLHLADDTATLTATEAYWDATTIEQRGDRWHLAGRATVRNGRATRENENEDENDGEALPLRARVTAASIGYALELAPKVDSVRAVNLDATLTSLDVETAVGQWTSTLPMVLSARGTPTALRLKMAPTAATIGPGHEPSMALWTESVAATLGGTLVLDTTTARADPVAFDLDASPLGTVRVTGTVSPTKAALHVVAADLDVEPWLAHFDALDNAVPTGYSLTGKAGLEVDVDAAAGQPWRLRGVASLAQGGLASDDGSRVIQGLPVNADVTMTGCDAAGAIHVNTRARVGGFQMLWGSVFADYSEHRASVNVDANWPGDDPSAQSGSAPWHLTTDWLFEGAASSGAPRGRLTLGDHPDGGLDYRLSMTSDDLATALEEDVRAPFQGSVPWLDALEVAGRLQLDLAGRWDTDQRSAAGRLDVERGLGAFANDAFRAEGLELTLPLDLVWQRGPPDTITGPPLRGQVAFARLVAGGLAFEPVATALQVEGATVGFERGLSGPFLGGRLVLGELALVDLLHGTRHVRTAVELRQVDLAIAAQRLGLPPLEGTLGGAFPRVRANAERFEVEGDGAFNVFGGAVRVFDIEGSEIFSRYPRLTFSADFADIDLEQVTRTFDFGVMTGWVEGELRRCELFRGVPVRCAGRVVSVPDARVKRFIDVKAVNNISILGTGGQIGRLDRGLHRFLRRFTYRALGVEVALKEDRFRLSGLLTRDSRELFLKGRLPFPIDIVNVEPGNTVSFQTMLSRLRNFQISTDAPP